MRSWHARLVEVSRVPGPARVLRDQEVMPFVHQFGRIGVVHPDVVENGELVAQGSEVGHEEEASLHLFRVLGEEGSEGNAPPQHLQPQRVSRGALVRRQVPRIDFSHVAEVRAALSHSVVGSGRQTPRPVAASYDEIGSALRVGEVVDPHLVAGQLCVGTVRGKEHRRAVLPSSHDHRRPLVLRDGPAQLSAQSIARGLHLRAKRSDILPEPPKDQEGTVAHPLLATVGGRTGRQRIQQLARIAEHELPGPHQRLAWLAEQIEVWIAGSDEARR